MHPGAHAADHPDKAAIIMATSGETITYGELASEADRIGQLFRSAGLQEGDHIAFCLENHPRFLPLVWGAFEAGLVYTAMSSRLTTDEMAYIINDCGARAFVTSMYKADAAAELVDQMPDVELRLMIDGVIDGYESYEQAVEAQPAEPLPEPRVAGRDMLYSSGTTGRPKGVSTPLTGDTIEAATAVTGLGQLLLGYRDDMVCLSPAPLYHAAPLRFVHAVHQTGGTVVVMEHFDPEEYLRLIERYHVTHSQVVPTMFIRMLKLPAEVRARYDLSSLEMVVHAAAPCPKAVKEQMIEWWGPVIHEYYAGTEGNGFCWINSDNWLAHKGSVGQAVLGELRICDEEGNEVPPRTEGAVYFANGPAVNYHNAPDKTAESYNQHGWTTLGDVGWVDEEGYLYLTDRKSFMIISGGVNIYPQEIENLLITHPKVADAAVVGAPHEEMGEQVVAVIQPLDGSADQTTLAEELMAFARANLSHVKSPKRIDFMAELPRHPTGKLYKRLIRDAYWGKDESRIV